MTTDPPTTTESLSTSATLDTSAHQHRPRIQQHAESERGQQILSDRRQRTRCAGSSGGSVMNGQSSQGVRPSAAERILWAR